MSLSKYLKVTAGITCAALAVYATTILVPAFVAQTAAATAAGAFKAGVASLPFGSTIANTTLVGTIAGQVATIASGEAYAAVTANAVLGITPTKVFASAAVGYTTGSQTMEYIVNGASNLLGAITKKICKEKEPSKNWVESVAQSNPSSEVQLKV
jgi:hypothetical protein